MAVTVLVAPASAAVTVLVAPVSVALVTARAVSPAVPVMVLALVLALVVLASLLPVVPVTAVPASLLLAVLVTVVLAFRLPVVPVTVVPDGAPVTIPAGTPVTAAGLLVPATADGRILAGVTPAGIIPVIPVGELTLAGVRAGARAVPAGIPAGAAVTGLTRAGGTFRTTAGAGTRPCSFRSRLLRLTPASSSATGTS